MDKEIMPMKSPEKSYLIAHPVLSRSLDLLKYPLNRIIWKLTSKISPFMAD